VRACNRGRETLSVGIRAGYRQILRKQMANELCYKPFAPLILNGRGERTAIGLFREGIDAIGGEERTTIARERETP
jgi:hypothetical protein